MAQYLLMKDDTGYWKDQFSGECFDFDPLIIKNTDFEPANVEAVLLYLDRSVGDAYFTMADGEQITFNIFEFEGSFDGFESEFNASSVGTNPGMKPSDSAGSDYVAVIGDSIVQAADGVIDAVGFGLPFILGIAGIFILISTVWGFGKRTIGR